MIACFLRIRGLAAWLCDCVHSHYSKSFKHSGARTLTATVRCATSCVWITIENEANYHATLRQCQWLQMHAWFWVGRRTEWGYVGTKFTESSGKLLVEHLSFTMLFTFDCFLAPLVSMNHMMVRGRNRAWLFSRQSNPDRGYCNNQ